MFPSLSVRGYSGFPLTFHARADRALARPTVRYARWDLSTIDLVDPRTGKLLCELFPIDKARNALGRRVALQPVADHAVCDDEAGIAPLLSSQMAECAASGLPPAYLPLTERDTPEDPDHDGSQPRHADHRTNPEEAAP